MSVLELLVDKRVSPTDVLDTHTWLQVLALEHRDSWLHTMGRGRTAVQCCHQQRGRVGASIQHSAHPNQWCDCAAQGFHWKVSRIVWVLKSSIPLIGGL